MQTKQVPVVDVSQNEEQAIRDLVKTWLAASEKGDLTTMLNLLADDVIFMVPGKEPFGKETFARAVILAAMGYHFRKLTEEYCR